MKSQIFITLVISLNIYNGFNISCFENINLYKQDCYDHDWKSFTDDIFSVFGVVKYTDWKIFERIISLKL